MAAASRLMRAMDEAEEQTEPVFDVFYRVCANVLAAIGLMAVSGSVGFYFGFFFGGAK